MYIIENLQWQPEIGDPSFMGWFTVASYFTAAIVTLPLGFKNKEKNYNNKSMLIIWRFIAITLFFLGINKQLDLQSLLTDVGRIISKNQGWYEKRREVQAIFVLLFSGISTIVFISSIWFIRYYLKKYFLLLFGLFYLITFIIIRAASFHHFERICDLHPGGLRMNWVFELTGIFCILISGAIEHFQRKRQFN